MSRYTSKASRLQFPSGVNTYLWKVPSTHMAAGDKTELQWQFSFLKKFKEFSTVALRHMEREREKKKRHNDKFLFLLKYQMPYVNTSELMLSVKHASMVHTVQNGHYGSFFLDFFFFFLLTAKADTYDPGLQLPIVLVIQQSSEYSSYKVCFSSLATIVFFFFLNNCRHG